MAAKRWLKHDLQIKIKNVHYYRVHFLEIVVKCVKKYSLQDHLSGLLFH